jgi:hypothetical protein
VKHFTEAQIEKHAVREQRTFRTAEIDLRYREALRVIKKDKTLTNDLKEVLCLLLEDARYLRLTN